MSPMNQINLSIMQIRRKYLMKKLFVFWAVWSAILFLAGDVFANIDQLSNMSAEWIRLPTRNAATDATDIVVYNPAGLTKLSDGFHVNIANQTLSRKPKHTYNLGLPGKGEQSHEQDSVDWFLPNIYTSYKQDKWSLFTGIYIPGGGAVVDYPDGSISTNFISALTVLGSSGAFTGYSNDYLEASSTYLTGTIGGAYSIDDKMSFALGLRYISAKNTLEAGATFTDVLGNSHEYKLDREDTADGFGAILGFNLAPMDKLNLGVRYETKVNLEFETEVNRNDFPAEFGLAEYKGKSRRDFPALFGMGVSYDITPKLMTEVDFSWYFQSDADWGKTTDGRDIADMAGDAWSSGIGLAYQLTPKLQVSTGALYTKFDWKDIAGYYETIGAFEVLYSDNWNLSIGCAYEVKQDVKLNLGLAWTIWKDETIPYNLISQAGLGDASVKTENSTITFALGIDAAF
ncbi:MAG: hypothetical protein C4522_15500 [Desulfobacteraceae bacterium]|nr:MAG: hypothetical protein C4522_15500 [Desulfobacteraceae bacterium]